MSQELIAKALTHIDAEIERILRLGEPELRIGVLKEEPKSLREIRDEIVKGTKEGLEHAQIWASDESEIRRIQREARLRR